MRRWTRALLGLFLMGSGTTPTFAGDGCVANGPYFGANADATVQRFAPGVASTQHHDDFAPVFAADGSEAILRILGKVDGKMVGSFFVTTMDESGCWSPPTVLPFSGHDMDGAIAYAPGESSLFFTSRRAAPGDADGFQASRVWRVARVDGKWEQPELLESPANRFNINGGLTVDGDGNLFVAMESELGVGGSDIFLLRNVDGRYPTIEMLPGAVNTPGTEIAPYIDPARRFLLFTTRSGNSTAIRLSLPDGKGGWGAGVPLPALGEESAKFAALTPDCENLLFVSNRQNEGANPQASWALDLYDAPVMENNADVYWLRSKGVLPELADGIPVWNPTSSAR